MNTENIIETAEKPSDARTEAAKEKVTLELKGIKKDYPAGDGAVHALKGIDLKFRESEFVSVLGPSGCGKTTMLNIIGGLDKYTEGDLVINGRSTKDFKDRDWDAYRNHSIGFVFQSYNLIPHQTVLRNVELSLTLSGVGRKERRERAIEALKAVGLETQINKRPSEMSGGQMQRVAIARALVNNPDIILADEPTGALDTKTSLQVMDILKEVSRTKLVIMVTHNPELAEKYSTRIIGMRDGLISGDSMPIEGECEYAEPQSEEAAGAEKSKKGKKPSMKFHTAFMLSLKNLFTKKGRTILTAFAGSIGIIGIALILAVSQGATTYINIVQEETLSSYPLTIEAEHTDITSLMESFMGKAESGTAHPKDAVYQKNALYNLAKSLGSVKTTENDLKSFKAYIDEKLKTDENLQKAVMGVKYSYDLDLEVYTRNTEGKVIRSDTSEITKELYSVMFGSGYSTSMSAMSSSSGGIFSSFIGNTRGNRIWEELLGGNDGQTVNDVLKSQYELVRGDWPTAYDQIVIVVDENNEIDDMTLYALGLKTKEEMQEIINTAKDSESAYVPTEGRWTYEEITDMRFRVLLSPDCYVKNADGTYSDMRENEYFLGQLYDDPEKHIDLNVVGIIRPKKDATSTMLSGTVGYTSKLTEYVIKRAKNSDIVKEQLADKDVDVITGLPFKPAADATNEELGRLFDEYVAAIDKSTEDGKKKRADIYVTAKAIMPTEDMMNAAGMAEYNAQSMTESDIIEGIIGVMFDSSLLSDPTINKIVKSLSDQTGSDLDLMTGMTYVGADAVREILSSADKDTLAGFYALTESMKAVVNYARNTMQDLRDNNTVEQLSDLLDTDTDITDADDAHKALYYRVSAEFSASTYSENLVLLGYFDQDTPSKIYLYASTFANKDILTNMIKDYNAEVDDYSKISYTDYVGLLMSSVTIIINAITYVLIAFVAISLVVSSIMIGVITLISVQERTKEIGILRAIGASKRNVSSMFNAETVIIGFAAGLLGVLVTYVLCIPINAILHALTGIGNLNAILPIGAAAVLVLISVALTLIAGIIPSRSAAKKDPVVALRTE